MNENKQTKQTNNQCKTKSKQINLLHKSHIYQHKRLATLTMHSYVLKWAPPRRGAYLCNHHNILPSIHLNEH